jgi:ammonium transporter Rh
MPPVEGTPLLAAEPTEIELSKEPPSPSTSGAASKTMEAILVVAQTFFILFFVFGTTYAEVPYSVKEYVAFRDVMAMLLLGFGYLMTFLRSYGLGAVGLTMIFTVLSMQANIPFELLMRYIYGGSGEEDATLPLPISMPTLVDAQFSAATLLISFGALIGRVTPLQMTVLTLCEALFYAFNKAFLVLGIVGAEDVGGSMTIHMFGAYFGLSVSYALGPPASTEHNEPDKVSDVLALIGTTVLWVFWPSFVGATETGIPLNEMLCVNNTVMALLGSTTAAFYFSYKLTHSKFDPVHVANSTLAGGVAIGSSGRLNIGPGGALVLGALAGTASVFGYVYSTPFLRGKFGIFDTCGVGNLHGWPSVVGALMSIIYVAVDSEAEFLVHATGPQMLRQFLGVVATLAVSMISGFGTGKLIKTLPGSSPEPHFHDKVWWHTEYY